MLTTVVQPCPKERKKKRYSNGGWDEGTKEKKVREAKEKVVWHSQTG